MEALVTIPGAEPWSSAGVGATGETGVILVHGFTGNPIATRALGQRLARDGYAVEVVLLPGHGTSVRDLARTRYDDWYAAVERALDNLRRGCARVVVVGHSAGGTLGLDLASRRREDVDGVVTINAQVLSRQDVLARAAPVLQYVVPYVPREMVGLPTDDIRRPGASEHAYPVVPARASQSLLAQLPRIRGQLSDLDTGVLVAHSPQDHTVPADNSEALVELLEHAEVDTLVLERSYHVPMLDYDAQRLEEAVAGFVAKVASR